MTDPAELLVTFVSDAVAELIRTEDFGSFRSWVQMQLPRLPAELRAEHGGHRAMATGLALSLWRSTPHPLYGFKPAPMPEHGRNAPCPCGSGEKYKRCCSGPLLPLESDMILQLVLHHADPSDLGDAVRRGALPSTAAGAAALGLLDQGEPEKALALVKPLFDQPRSRLRRLDERYEAALNALLDAYGELGDDEGQHEWLERLASSLRPPLRTEALVRLAIHASDRQDHDEAVALLERAVRDDPEHLSLPFAEVLVLEGAGKRERAVVRARFWLAKLEQEGFPPDDDLVAFLSGYAEAPGREMIAGALSLPFDRDQVERLLALVDEHRGRPLPDYRLVESPEDFEGWGEGEGRWLVPPDEVRQVELLWETVHPWAFAEALNDEWDDDWDDDLDEDWDGDSDEDFEDSIFDEEADPWDPDCAAVWLALLSAHPVAFDSLRILRDLGKTSTRLPSAGTRAFDRELLLPLCERGVAILERALTVDPAEAGADLALDLQSENTVACLDLLGNHLFTLDRLGEHDQAQAAADRLLAIDPVDVHGARVWKIGRALDAGENERALDLALEAEADSSMELLFLKVLALYRLGRLDEGREALERPDLRVPTVARLLAGEITLASLAEEEGELESVVDATMGPLLVFLEMFWKTTPGAVDWMRATWREREELLEERRLEAPKRRAERREAARGKICRLKIALPGLEPEIWRRIELPLTSTFEELHREIQRAMGWLDCHLHQFEAIDPDTGELMTIEMPDPDGFPPDEEPVLYEADVRLSDFLTEKTPRISYLYDFGDSWHHSVTLEAVEKKARGERYPRVVDGARACPPEDCGGIYGYDRLLAVIQDPDHPEREELLEWLGGSFDPELYEPAD